MATETKKRLVGHIVLDVHARYASVSRFIETARGDLALQVATNAEELAADAWVEIRRKGGGAKPVMGGRYTCPPELAARATWE